VLGDVAQVGAAGGPARARRACARAGRASSRAGAARAASDTHTHTHACLPLLPQGEFPLLELVPLEEDVVSLELKGALRDCILDGDSTPLFYAARALLELQCSLGLFPRIQARARRRRRPAFARPWPLLRLAAAAGLRRPPAPPPALPPQGKGPAAAAVKDIMTKLRRQLPSLPPSALAAPRIGRLILIDREVDLITPLLTQVIGRAGGLLGWRGRRCVCWVGRRGGGSGASPSAGVPVTPTALAAPPLPPLQITFEGLIDEVLGIKNGIAAPPTRKAGEGPEGSKAGARVAQVGCFISVGNRIQPPPPPPPPHSCPSSPQNPPPLPPPPRPPPPTPTELQVLNSTDPFYKEFRDLPYYLASQRLQQYARWAAAAARWPAGAAAALQRRTWGGGGVRRVWPSGPGLVIDHPLALGPRRDARKEYSELAQKDMSQLKGFVKGLPRWVGGSASAPWPRLNGGWGRRGSCRPPVQSAGMAGSRQLQSCEAAAARLQPRCSCPCRLQLLERLADVAGPVAEVVKQQSFHDRLQLERDIVDGRELDAGIEAATVGACCGAAAARRRAAACSGESAAAAAAVAAAAARRCVPGCCTAALTSRQPCCPGAPRCCWRCHLSPHVQSST
jgi:hypothetical protein